MSEEIINYILGIASIVVPSVTAFSINYNMRHKKYRLSIGEVKCYSILNQKHGNINIGVSFNGSVMKNIIHLSFSISNTGSSDLDESIINKPITIIVPKCFRILDALAEIEKEIQETKWNDNSIYIRTNLLKSKEKMKVTIFVIDAYQNNEDIDYCDLLFNSLSFNCRFPNLEKVKIEKYKTRKILELEHCMANRINIITMVIIATAIPFFIVEVIFKGESLENYLAIAFIFVNSFIIGFLSFDIVKCATGIYKNNSYNKKLSKILSVKGELKNN